MVSSLFGDSSDDQDVQDKECEAIDYEEVKSVKDIPGLYYLSSFLSKHIQATLLQGIADNGYFANVDSETEAKPLDPGRSDQAMIFGSLPSWLEDTGIVQAIVTTLTRHNVKVEECHQGKVTFNQCILNLYRPGQGLGHHVDLVDRFHDGIIVISLLSGIMMEFEKRGDQTVRKGFYLHPGDVLFLCGPSRYDWTHGIPARTEDIITVNGQQQTVVRRLRVSITLRKLIE